MQTKRCRDGNYIENEVWLWYELLQILRHFTQGKKEKG